MPVLTFNPKATMYVPARCADCYYRSYKEYQKGDQVITTDETETGLAICDDCGEQF